MQAAFGYGADVEFEVAPGQFREPKLGGDHLSLFGDPDGVIDRTWRLAEDGSVSWSATPPYGATASMEQATFDAVFVSQCNHLLLCII